MPEEILNQYLFDHPGHYQIRVLGALDQSWLDHLDGLDISVGRWGNHQKVTLISGWLSDQTALGGLLDLLNDLGMVILTVERQESNAETK